MSRELDMTVALFPGQGAYRPGALKEFWESGDRTVRSTFEEVDAAAKELVGRAVSPTVFQPSPPSPAALLESAPDVLQLAVFTTAVATHRLLAERGAAPSVHLGHSLGELAALTCAGAWDLADAAKILCERISVLREHDHSGGVMLALGCDRERAERIVGLIGDPGLVLAVDNGPQSVLSGRAEPIATAEAVAAQLGIARTRLRSPHPFHHPLLENARGVLAERLASFPSRPLDVPVYSPILGRFYRDGDDLARLLALHLVTPVEFGPAVSALHAAGARVFVEAGAGRVLSALVEEARPGVHVVAPLAGRDEEAGLAAAADALRSPLTRGSVPVSTGPESAALTSPVTPPAPVVPEAVPETAAVATPPVPDRDELVGRVRALYAEAMEYPEEVFTDDVQLEADLGVDSVKQTELLSRLGDRFGLGLPPTGLRVADYDTFGKVVDFVAAGVTDGADTGSAAGR
ncbi:acyltransferase domain-containing protein [Streptomyces sp. PTY087I2]|uniref:acyltransferase domain-containing protein n=1 Tax=Streptomyces sp. PTY087I2 TaxID=1819298 RepID=UPI000828241B|nr:acyltransferase domain-containing protein [Streptomyces sp. PTY087I2]OCC10602.1 Erythronolide synthase, modules 1 and 2 [Streptomyces sp. PTY087I2]